jgi:hypothetical protein
MDRSGKKEEKRDKIPLSQKTLLDNGEKIVWVMGAARGLSGWGRTRRVLCSSSTQFFLDNGYRILVLAGAVGERVAECDGEGD